MLFRSQVQVPLTAVLVNLVSDLASVRDESNAALRAHASQIGSIECTFRRRRYSALLHGIDGEITVAGSTFKGSMPAFKQLGDAELAAVASYVRSEWANHAAAIKPEVFATERKASPRTAPFAGESELKALAGKPSS